MEHWRVTAKRCVANKENAVFCDSLSTDNACLWVGVYGDETIKFYNIIAPSSHLEIAGRIVAAKAGHSSFTDNPAGLSFWKVPTAYIKCLADSIE